MSTYLCHFSTSQYHWPAFLSILEHLDRMAEVSFLALTCRTLHMSLSRFLLNHLSMPENPLKQERHIFSLLAAGIFYHSLDSALFFEQIVTLRYAHFYGEKPLQHLIRNYLVFVPPSIGLHKEELIKRVEREHGHLIDRFMALDENQIRPLLRESCPENLSLVELKGELCKNTELLKQLLEAPSLKCRQQLLNEQKAERDRRDVEALANIELNFGNLCLSDTVAKPRLIRGSQPLLDTAILQLPDERLNFFSIPCGASKNGGVRLRSAPRNQLRDLRPRLAEIGIVK